MRAGRVEVRESKREEEGRSYLDQPGPSLFPLLVLFLSTLVFLFIRCHRSSPTYLPESFIALGMPMLSCMNPLV